MSIYKVLSLFNLQITLLLSCIGAVLYLTGALSSSRVLLVIFLMLLVGSVVYAAIATLKKFLRLDKKKDKKKMQIVEGQSSKIEEISKESVISQPQHPYGFQTETTYDEPEKPKYFRVKGHPDYIMAEYSDRYELYKVVNGQMIKIRTDYKF